MANIIWTVLLFLPMMRNSYCLVPPKFQWKQLDYDWPCGGRESALNSKGFVPENILPIGIARWGDKIFVTVPRWKSGVPSSLNYIDVDGEEDQPLKPYPSWDDAYVKDAACCIPSNSTVVNAFRVHVDECDRLWVVDTGIADISGLGNQVTEPAIVIFDLNTDTLIRRHTLGDDAIKGPESFFTSITVEVLDGDCSKAYAYIPDMGANALVVYNFENDVSWHVTHPYFHFDPHAGSYNVGGIEFYWSDGITAVSLAAQKCCGKDNYRDLYFHPVSSTKEFKISTRLLRNKDTPQFDIFNGVTILMNSTVGTDGDRTFVLLLFQDNPLIHQSEINGTEQILGDRGEKGQSSACDLDHQNNVLFYTQISKNGIGCWNTEKPFTPENNPLVVSDCNLFEFPSDVKVDKEGDVWMLSNKMPRFLYSQLDPNQINFRILTASVKDLTHGTTCEMQSMVGKCMSFIKGK